jgi:putative transposase
VELFNIDWENTDIKDWAKVNKFLEKYRWSSYLDYIGKNNFSSVTSRNFLEGLFNNRDSHKKFINEYLSDDLAKIKSETLE